MSLVITKELIAQHNLTDDEYQEDRRDSRAGAESD